MIQLLNRYCLLETRGLAGQKHNALYVRSIMMITGFSAMFAKLDFLKQPKLVS